MPNRGHKQVSESFVHGFMLRRSLCALAFSLLLSIVSAPASAGPALVFEAASGRVLYAEDQDNAWHPASLTKIMTAYMTFEALKAGKLTPQSKITASEVSVVQEPSKIGLPVGATMTVELAINALIIKSANDVAVMLAEAMAGSVEEFAKQMTATAKRLGMTRTTFVNAHGLPAAEQVTTARDLAILSMAVLKDFPEYAALWHKHDVRIGRRVLRTHNGLLKTYDGADGMKTGFICDSGYNVVASASRDNRRLVAVVLGELSGASRTIRAAGLLEHGFQVAAWTDVMPPSYTVRTLPIAADAKTQPASVRTDLLSRECNPGRRRPPSVAAIAKAKQKRAELAKKAAAGAPAAEPVVTTGSVPAAAKKPAPAATKTAGPQPAAKTTN